MPLRILAPDAFTLSPNLSDIIQYRTLPQARQRPTEGPDHGLSSYPSLALLESRTRRRVDLTMRSPCDGLEMAPLGRLLETVLHRASSAEGLSHICWWSTEFPTKTQASSGSQVWVIFPAAHHVSTGFSGLVCAYHGARSGSTRVTVRSSPSQPAYWKVRRGRGQACAVKRWIIRRFDAVFAAIRLPPAH